MKRLFVRFVVVVAVLAVVGAALAYSLLNMSLPQIDGEVLTDGVTAEVTIERDAAGIPEITAANRVDLAYATGYVHGQDRFFQMDLTRRNAAGELSELFGAVALPVDKEYRLHRFRNRAEAVVRDMDDSQAAIANAYANGVNDGLASLNAKPFEYFLIGTNPKPWEPADSILAGFTMYLQLNDERAHRDVRRGLAQQALPPEVFTWLYPQGTEWDAPMTGAAREDKSIPGPEIINLNGTTTARAITAIYANGEPLMPGSNNWAVAGNLTDTGAAIVANDMHLGITTPNVFYRVRLRTSDAAGIDLTGVTLPGVPILVAGSNGRVAWGNTNSYGDWSDAVIVQPGATDGTYRTPNGDKAFDVQREAILVKGGEPEVLEVRETIWGPVLDDGADPEREIAVSWIAHHASSASLNHLLLETVENVDDAMRIANSIDMPPQNFVVGDSAGNIGWTIAGRIPRREGFDPELPADWSETGGWNGWLTPAEYPRIKNPPSGRIWTANARVVDADALSIVGDGGYDLGARAKQIRDGLFAIDRYSADDMLTVQLDDRAVFLDRWRDLLLETLDDEAIAGNAGRAHYRELAEAWIPRASTDSVGYRLVRAFRGEVRNRVFTMLMQPVSERYGEDTELRMSKQFEGPLWQMLTEQPTHLINENYVSWRDLMLAAVDENIEYFDENYEDGLDRRTWGERNTAVIRHPLSRALPLLSGWLDMPAEPLPGDSNLPRAQGPSFGASERFAVSPGSEERGYLHMPAGQSGHPLSDFYRVGHDDWVHGRPSPFLPGEPRHTLVLKPAG